MDTLTPRQVAGQADLETNLLLESLPDCALAFANDGTSLLRIAKCLLNEGIKRQQRQ